MSNLNPAQPLNSSTESNSARFRIHHLVEWLRSGKPLTTSLAAQEFDVSRRTISRDLAYIRDTLSLDVSFDATQRSYVLAAKHMAIPFLAFPSLAPILISGTTESRGQHDAGISEVRVRFSARAIRGYLSRGGTIRENVLNEDGTVEVYFQLENLDEFTSYALSRGRDIEVLAPPALRHRIHMEIRRMLSIYRPDGLDGP